MKKELISVIVPVYNVEKYLERCVYSILNQTYQTLEIILVDDGSPDNSGYLCDDLAKKDNRIKVIHKKNGGLSEARNYGKDVALGKYIIFIDSDDYIHKDMIESLYDQMIREDADVSICGVMNVYSNSESPQCEDTNLYFVCNEEVFLKEYLIGERIPGGIWNKLFKRQIVKNIDFPVGKIYEDAYYQYELIKVAKKYVVNTKPYYYYYHREGSIVSRPYRDLDYGYIEIYSKYYKMVERDYPKFKEEAFFRYAYAHFFVLDKILLLDTYKQAYKYNEVNEFLRKNTFRIINNKIFRKGRRIAALALFISIKLYRELLMRNIERTKKLN